MGSGSVTATEAAAPKLIAGQPLAPASISFGPYVGPRPFEKDEERLFFGRDREARDLISLIIANRVFILYSQSGAGKSSLLNAKVITGLEKQQCQVLPIARVQGKLPLALNETQIRNIFSLNALLSLREVAPNLGVEQLSTFKIADFIAPLYANRADDEDPIVLLFDQFEELFTFYEYRWKDRGLFITEIVEALSKFPELKVVFSLREDYIAKLDTYSRDFPDRLRARYLLERLQEGPASRAIAGPVETSERRYEDGVAEAIVQDLLETQSRDIQGKPVIVRGEYVEPVQLQVVCSNLWSSVPPDKKVITKRDLEDSGSVNQALANFYDTSLAKIVSETHVPELEIRRWFEKALVTPAGTRGTVFRDTNLTAEMPNRVVDAFENCHLIRGDWRAGAQWYEITHDRLLRPIRESNRVWLERVERKRRIQIGGAVAIIVSCVVVLLAWSLDTARHAVRREEDAVRREEAQALASSLINASSRLSQNNLDLALLLAVEAFQARDSTFTRSNLLSQVLRAERVANLRRIGARELMNSIAIPDSDIIASTTFDRHLVVWSQKDGILANYSLGGEFPFSLFADQTRLYAIPYQGSVAQAFSIEQLKSGEGLKAQIVAGGSLAQLRAKLNAFGSIPTADSNLSFQRDPDIKKTAALAGNTLLTGNGDQVIVSNFDSGAEIARFSFNSENRKVVDVGLSSDGMFAYAVACDIDDGNISKAKNLSSQSQAPATGGCGPRTVKLWQIEKARELRLFSPFPVNSQAVAIGSSKEFLWIAALSSDGSAIRAAKYQLAQDSDPKKIGGVSLSANSPVADLLFSGSSHSLISISGTQTISWNLDGPRRLEHKVRDGSPLDIAVGKNGALAAVTADEYFVLSNDYERVQLSVKAPRPPDLSPREELISAVALSYDAQKLLVAQYGVIQFLDIASRRKLSINIAPAGTISVAVDPLGQFIASGFMPPWLVQAERSSPVVSNATPIDYSRVPVLWKMDGQQPALFVDLTPGAKAPAANANSPSPNAGDKVPADNDNKPLVAAGVGFSPDGKYFVVTHGPGTGTGNVTFYARQNVGGGESASAKGNSGTGEAAFTKLDTFATDAVAICVEFSKDGKLLAVSQINGEIVLIDVETRRQLGKLPAAISSETDRLAFSSDGALLAAVSFKGGVILWDIATRTQFGRAISLGEIEGPVGVAFSPDNRRLITADENLKSLVTFDLDIDSWITQACDVARRQLSAEELVTYNLPPQLQSACGGRELDRLPVPMAVAK
jgi:WD40 repeat protein